jgi:hypothetical protein
MAGIAPDFMSFFATSLASRASAGRLGVIGFSGSGFGAFKACRAFFYTKQNRSWPSFIMIQ